MAGSFHDFIDENFELKTEAELNTFLKNTPDLYAAIEHMYGMIYYMSTAWGTISHTHPTYAGALKSTIKRAAKDYEIGLRLSPTDRYRRRKNE